MSETASYIAVDLGAESGRVMLGTMAAGKLHLEELHRFSNGPVEVNGSLRWDFDRLLSEVKTGIGLAAKKAKSKPLGVGVDTWGVDFGLIGDDGRLMEAPFPLPRQPDQRHDGQGLCADAQAGGL